MERLEELIERFRTRKESHPCISSLWINYLEAKKDNLMNRIEQAERILDEMPDTDDINVSLLMCMLACERN